MTIINMITIKDKEIDISIMTKDERADLAKDLNKVALASIGYEEKKEKG